jgi:integrase
LAKIKTVTLANGEKRYRFTIDVGAGANGRRQQRTFTFSRLTDARGELARLSNDTRNGTFVDRSRMTVGELCDRYLEHAAFQRSENTKVSYRGALEPVRLRLGSRRAQSIDRRDLEALRDWMLEHGRRRGGAPGTGLSARSVRLTFGRLSSAFELAVRDRKLTVNPCRYVTMPELEPSARTTWSEDEVRTFLKVAAEDRLHACWRLSLYGLRRGEVLGLRWSDVDLEARTVNIGNARVLVGEVVEKAPKSKRGYRTLPLDDSLVTALRSLRKQQAAERLAAGQAYSSSGYVAVDELGYAVHPEGYSDHFARLSAAAGVPRCRLHDARHSASSLMARLGVPPHIRSAFLGHTTVINEQVYTHSRPEDLVMARDALSKIHNAV